MRPQAPRGPAEARHQDSRHPLLRLPAAAAAAPPPTSPPFHNPAVAAVEPSPSTSLLPPVRYTVALPQPAAAAAAAGGDPAVMPHAGTLGLAPWAYPHNFIAPSRNRQARGGASWNSCRGALAAPAKWVLPPVVPACSPGACPPTLLLLQVAARSTERVPERSQASRWRGWQACLLVCLPPPWPTAAAGAARQPPQSTGLACPQVEPRPRRESMANDDGYNWRKYGEKQVQHPCC